MGPLDLIEKAINEHASAAVLKERLELIREQAAATEKRIAVVQDEN
jgi:hypothetical protein